MIECKELARKTVRSLTLYEDSIDGPEVVIEFTDGDTFSACLKLSSTLEAKVSRDDGGQPLTVKNYSTPAVAR